VPDDLSCLDGHMRNRLHLGRMQTIECISCGVHVTCSRSMTCYRCWEADTELAFGKPKLAIWTRREVDRACIVLAAFMTEFCEHVVAFVQSIAY